LKKHTKGYLMVAIAASLWGTVGIQVKILFDYNVSIQSIVFWRMFLPFYFTGFIILP